MKKKILSLITAFALAVTTVCGGLALADGAEEVHAADAQGGMLWYAKVSGSNMQGMCSPAVDENGYVYVAAGKVLYKYDGITGASAGSVTLPASIGYNKIAPELGGGYVFVPLGGAQVAIVNASTMKLVKTVTYASGQTGHQSITPVEYSAVDNAIYLGSWKNGQGGTYARVSLSDDSVEMLATSSTGFYWAGACAEGDYVVFGSNAPGSDATPTTGDAVLYVYNKSTGEVIQQTLSGSGSICSTVVKSGDAYYFTGKNKKLYKAVIAADGSTGEDSITVSEAALGGVSTCTPLISEDGMTAYVGFASGVNIIDLSSFAVTKMYSAPADVKGLALSGGKLYATYNSSPGGIYDVMGAADYFVPHRSMQQYCISGIAKSPDGSILYYTNDSNTLMAVKAADSLISVSWKGADSAGDIAARAYTGGKIEPEVVVTYGGRTLTQNTHYTVTYSNNVNPGTATAVVKGKGSYGGTTILTFEIKAPAVAAQKTVRPTLYGYDDMQVKWNAQEVAGATVKYKVQYQRYGKSWNTLSDGMTATSLKKTNLADGARYRFKVTPYVTVDGKNYYGTAKTSSYVYTLKKVAGVKVSKKSKKYVKVKWTNISGETGYQIARSTRKSKNYKVIKTCGCKKKTTTVKATRYKKYYYKVRAYKTVNGKKIYGPWSSVKSYKLK